MRIRGRVIRLELGKARHSMRCAKTVVLAWGHQAFAGLDKNTEFVNGWGTEIRLGLMRTGFGKTMAVFTGPDGKAWRATRVWNQVPEGLLRPAREPLTLGDCASRADSDLQGKWEAVARPWYWYWPFASLCGKVRIAEPAAGVFQAEFDFPTLNLNGLPVFVAYHPPDVELIAKSGSGMFRGRINGEHTKMSGQYIAGGRRIGTLLQRTDY